MSPGRARLWLVLCGLAQVSCSVALPYPEVLAEVNCHDGVDDDQDGLVDCLDGECRAQCFESSLETCSDGLDNDADGVVDGADPQCWATAPPHTRRCVERRPVAFVETFGTRAMPGWSSALPIDESVVVEPNGNRALSLVDASHGRGRSLFAPAGAGPFSLSFHLMLPAGVEFRVALVDPAQAVPGLPVPRGAGYSYVELSRVGGGIDVHSLLSDTTISGRIETAAAGLTVAVRGNGRPERLDVTPDGEATVRLAHLPYSLLNDAAVQVAFGIDSAVPGAIPLLDDVRVVFDEPQQCDASTPRAVSCAPTQARVLATVALASGDRCVAVVGASTLDVWRSANGRQYELAGSVPIDASEPLSRASLAASGAGADLAFTTLGASPRLRVSALDATCGVVDTRVDVRLERLALVTVTGSHFDLALWRREPERSVAYLFAPSVSGVGQLRRLVEVGGEVSVDTAFAGLIPSLISPVSFVPVGRRDIVIVGRDLRGDAPGIIARTVPERETSSGPALDWLATTNTPFIPLLEDPTLSSSADRGALDGFSFDGESVGGGVVVYSSLDAHAESHAFVGCLEYTIGGLPSGFCEQFKQPTIVTPALDPACNEWESCASAPADCGACVGEVLDDDLLASTAWSTGSAGPRLVASAHSTAVDLDAVRRPMLAWELGSPGEARLPLPAHALASFDSRATVAQADDCDVSLVVEHERGDVAATWRFDAGVATLGLDGAAATPRIAFRPGERERIIVTSEASTTRLTLARPDGCDASTESTHADLGAVVAVRVRDDGRCVGAIDLMTLSAR